MNTRQSGFTLMEVLIAGLILFMTISTTTLIYRGAMLSSQKAEQTLVLNGYLPFAMEQIEQEMRQQKYADQTLLQGSGNLLASRYNWQAKQLLAKRPLPRLGASSTELIEQPARFKLWQVHLTLKYGGGEKRFSYKELTFQEIP
jgi:type II secretory pathway component PulJ